MTLDMTFFLSTLPVKRKGFLPWFDRLNLKPLKSSAFSKASFLGRLYFCLLSYFFTDFRKYFVHLSPFIIAVVSVFSACLITSSLGEYFVKSTCSLSCNDSDENHWKANNSPEDQIVSKKMLRGFKRSDIKCTK